jgi:hypothetical protein
MRRRWGGSLSDFKAGKQVVVGVVILVIGVRRHVGGSGRADQQFRTKWPPDELESEQPRGRRKLRSADLGGRLWPRRAPE